jgi:hypothetical protein
MRHFRTIADVVFSLDDEARTAEVEGKRQYAAGIRNATFVLDNAVIGPSPRLSVPLLDMAGVVDDLYCALDALVALAHNSYDLATECPEALAALAKARGEQVAA